MRLTRYDLKTPLTFERLRELLDYNLETGVFIWRCSRQGQTRVAGSVAGNMFKVVSKARTHTYRRICVDGRSYLAHRLAYFWMKGEWPRQLIDHKDSDGLNNRWENLRPATPAQNTANGRTYRNSPYGLKGVHVYAGGRVTAVCAGKYLGVFDTPKEAHAAYVKEAKRLWGEYARAA